MKTASISIMNQFERQKLLSDLNEKLGVTQKQYTRHVRLALDVEKQYMVENAKPEPRSAENKSRLDMLETLKIDFKSQELKLLKTLSSLSREIQELSG